MKWNKGGQYVNKEEKNIENQLLIVGVDEERMNERDVSF